MLHAMALQAAMLDVCISICWNFVIRVLNIIWVVVRKESILAVCLIQLAEVLMSVLGYIVMAMAVSLLCTSRFYCWSTCKSDSIPYTSFSSSDLTSIVCLMNLLPDVANWVRLIFVILYSCTQHHQSPAYKLNHKLDPHLHLYKLTRYWCHLDEGWCYTSYWWSKVQDLPDSDR